MCPDRELLSAFADGEVPSPWNERLASHVASCPSCAATLAGFRSLSERLKAAPSFEEQATVERIAARLGERLDGNLEEDRDGASLGIHTAKPPVVGGVFSRRVLVPLPFAAAALVLLALSAAFALRTYLAPARVPVQTLAVAEIAPQATERTSMEALIRYLESRDAQVNLTIELPREATFAASGKPFIVRAADYGPVSPASRPATPAAAGAAVEASTDPGAAGDAAGTADGAAEGGAQ